MDKSTLCGFTLDHELRLNERVILCKCRMHKVQDGCLEDNVCDHKSIFISEIRLLYLSLCLLIAGYLSFINIGRMGDSHPLAVTASASILMLISLNSFSTNDVYIRHKCDTSVGPTTYIYVRSSARVFSSQKCARKIGLYETFFATKKFFMKKSFEWHQKRDGKPNFTVCCLIGKVL